VLINPTTAWKAQHLRALDIHYARAPYRDRYLSELQELYARPWSRLNDLNKATVQWLLAAYGITTPVHSAAEYAARDEPTDRLIDLCRVVGASQYLAGPGAEHYMDKPRFESSGMRLKIQVFQHPIYRQVYEPFESNLSALDLLLMQGPNAITTLRRARSMDYSMTSV
ncbi:MAG TPA: WbqC family protein, partial [Nitrospira sp.]|nr:WbqC family protein [Nitrospira sp.]